jgi:hypothetical protein
LRMVPRNRKLQRFKTVLDTFGMQVLKIKETSGESGVKDGNALFGWI